MDGLLERINEPADLNGMNQVELENLCSEIRSLIIDTVSRTGGHLASNLGVVELTVALLKSFSPPGDKIIWDVSHQTYAYKILTGRRDRFSTIRTYGGLSGFLNRHESEYDAFGAGHSGTALSAALGMAAARDRRGGDEHVIAVIGDGALGCGISLEAFNNVSGTARKLIVVVNDNEMSIAANVGAISTYLGRLLASPRYNRWKRSVESVAKKMRMGWLRQCYYRLEELVKGVFLRSIVFEEFGLRYIGPVNGHSIPALLDAFSIARESDKPILIHVSTTKGKGYAPAESEPEKWHGASAFDVESGKPAAKAGGTSYSGVFGKTIAGLAESDSRIVAITAAMSNGVGLTEFARRFPDRFFDVGISEEHGAVFAAGLSAEGMIPVFALYSTFAQRIVDCVIHDVCLQDLPVVFCLDRAGVVGDDGATHNGVFDIALFRKVPGLVFMQPKDEAELADMLATALKSGRASMIRYPRGLGPGSEVPEERSIIEVGKAEVVRDGADVWIWALGDMLQTALDSAERLAEDDVSAGVVNARFISPLDTNLLESHLDSRLIVTIENAVKDGGFGSAVSDYVSSRAGGNRPPILRVGWPDHFVPHGSVAQLKEIYGLTPDAVCRNIRASLDSL